MREIKENQLGFLRKKNETNEFEIKDVSIKYGIPPSTLRNINKMTSNIFERLQIIKYYKIY